MKFNQLQDGDLFKFKTYKNPTVYQKQRSYYYNKVFDTEINAVLEPNKTEVTKVEAIFKEVEEPKLRFKDLLRGVKFIHPDYGECICGCSVAGRAGFLTKEFVFHIVGVGEDAIFEVELVE